MASVTTGWRISPVAWVAIGLAVAAEATSNALRAYGLGTYLEAFTVHVYGLPVNIAGAVLVFAAIAVSLSQARAAWVALMPGSPIQQRIVGGLIGVLLLSVSITAMSSTILEAQRVKTSDEDDTRGKYDRAQSSYKNANDELTKLVQANVRTVDKITAGINAAKVSSKVLEYTTQCTDFDPAKDLAQFRKSCQPLLDLRSELADAQRKAELETKVPKLKAEADKLKPKKEADVTEETVSHAWGWIMGFAVVFVATFGPVIFASQEIEQPREQPKQFPEAPVDFHPPPPDRKSKPLPKNVVRLHHPVVQAIEKAGRAVSNRELAGLMSVSEGEASKRCKEIEHLLDVGRQGKELRIGLRKQA